MADTTRFPVDFRGPDVIANPGNVFFGPIALTTPTPDFQLGVWQMLENVEGRLYGLVTVPNVIGGTPAAKIILTIAADATTGDTRLQVLTRAVANSGESLNGALVAETAQTVSVPTTALEKEEVTFTLTNAPAAKDTILVEVFHDGDLAADTLAVPTLIVKAALEIDLS